MLRQFLLFLALSFITYGCCDHDFDFECLTDVSVQSFYLTTVGTPVVGEYVNIRCEVRNMISAESGCGNTGDIPSRITYAYSSQSHSNFEDYDVYDIWEGLTQGLNSGEEVTGIMSLLLDQGPGYYAIRLELTNQNDANPHDNALAIAFQVTP